MGVLHIVLLEFKPNTDAEKIQDVCQSLFALKDKCIHPTTNEPYLKSLVGGRDISTEGRQRGITHAFVYEFDTEEDRKYYLEKDPEHRSFVQGLINVIACVQVVDFVPGAL